MIISEVQLNHRFFILGVLAAAIIPRQPSDHGNRDYVGWWVIGGRLSHSFRKLLLAIVAVNLCRLFLSNDYHRLECDLLGVVEVTGLTFLCFLTPYVLQQGLSQFFNIIPGQDLKCPLYLSIFLSMSGVVMSRTVHPNLWALKKLANASSSPPIIRTLRDYNSFTTSQSHGRGFVFAQTVMVIEYWHLILQLCCAAAYAFDRHLSGTDEETLFDSTMKATRSIAFAADWTRVLIHAIFMNQIDEMHHTSTNWTDDEEAGNDGNDEEESSAVAELVPLRKR